MAEQRQVRGGALVGPRDGCAVVVVPRDRWCGWFRSRFGGPPGEAEEEGGRAAVALYNLWKDGGRRGGGGVCG